MRASRSRLIAVAVVLTALGGAALAAGSFASGHAPAAVHRAAALAQRTFVSAATGNDANPCTRTAPCRNFAAAIAQTQSGGEVVVLDSGGYGTVTITQAVSLVAPAGVYAGISVFSGTGITVNAGSLGCGHDSRADAEWARRLRWDRLQFRRFPLRAGERLQEPGQLRDPGRDEHRCEHGRRGFALHAHGQQRSHPVAEWGHVPRHDRAQPFRGQRRWRC